MNVNELDPAELAKLVTKLQSTIGKLEGKVSELQAGRPVPDEDLVIIAATAAAYMGYQGKIRAIQYAGRDTTTLA